MIKLDSDEIKFITFFENRTRATVKDCIIRDNDVIVVVKSGQMGFAIGKNGETVNKLKKETGKEIHVYEHASDAGAFIKNVLFPVKVDRVDVNGESATVHVNEQEKKRAIGRGGKKINLVRELVERHFGIKEVRIA